MKYEWMLELHWFIIKNLVDLAVNIAIWNSHFAGWLKKEANRNKEGYEELINEAVRRRNGN